MSVDERLISMARVLCGDDAVQRVFEPLVADWDREFRDLHGAKRAAVALTGAFAYGRSIACCLDLREAVSQKPALTSSTVLLLFAAMGAALSLQPLHYTWIGFGVRFRWLPPSPRTLYFVPNVLAGYAGFAMLPAMLFATRWSVSRRRVAAFVCLTFATMLVVEGWVHPAIMRARSQVAAAGLPPLGRSRAQDIRIYTNTSDLITLAMAVEADVAQSARAALWDKVWLFALAGSCALLGAALGALGRRRGWRVTVRGAAALWLVSMLFFWIVAEWAWAVVMLLSLPRTASFWLPSAVFALLSVAIAIVAARTER